MSEHLGATRFVSAENLERLTKWAGRKPVIALMGEFSAGKSTLLNMLIGRSLLPMQVTATRLPPVWARYGTGPSYRVDHDGVRHDVDLHNPAAIPMDDTRYIRIYHDSGLLQKCDIIDTPGISDPNIPLNIWIKTIAYANSVLWCTPANQAWRESERGTWESLPARLRKNSLLLVTRADKLVSDLDQDKIDRRLERETGNLFGNRHFISLTKALQSLEGQGDPEAWVGSGAQAFMESFNKVIEATHHLRQSHLTRYKIGQSNRIVMPARPVTAPEDEHKPVVALHPARVARNTDGERESRLSQSDVTRIRSELHPPIGQEGQIGETAPTPETDKEKSKSRSVFSLRRKDREPDAAPSAKEAESAGDNGTKSDAAKADIGFHQLPGKDEEEKIADETKPDDVGTADEAMRVEAPHVEVANITNEDLQGEADTQADGTGAAGEDLRADQAQAEDAGITYEDAQGDEPRADSAEIGAEDVQEQEVSSEAEPRTPEEEFYEDEFTDAPGPEEVSNVIARIDAATPEATPSEPDIQPTADSTDESEAEHPAPRTASKIWSDILDDQEVETVAQMKEAITRLVTELDENAALSGTSELEQALG